ncbi:MAG: hypothetical protein KDK10_10035 [Maritimibacter sp.]|nr:hypothetical protein [Maritimibacter sp.]
MNLYVLLAVVNFLLAGAALASLAQRGAGNGLGLRLPTRRPGLSAAALKAAVGPGKTRAPARDATLERSLHRSSWGAKLFVFALSALLLVVTPRLATSGQLTPADLGSGYAAILALVVYLNAFVWAYRIAVSRDEICVMGLTFLMRRYPISALVKINDRGLYTWWLHFSDGRRHLALKTVVRLPALRHRLAHVTETNARG